MLGVCLGHQAIGQAFGGEVVRAPVPMHGKLSHAASHRHRHLRRHRRSPFTATRYHSLIVDRDEPAATALEITARPRTADHGPAPSHAADHGVQFHPESIAREHGHQLLAQFPAICARRQRAARQARAACHAARAVSSAISSPLLARSRPGETLTRAEAERGVRHHHVGRARRRRRSARLLMAHARARRDGAGDHRRGARHARADAIASRRPPAPSTSAAPAATAPARCNISTARRLRRRRLRRAGRQARQPRALLAHRRRRRAGRARRQHRLPT